MVRRAGLGKGLGALIPSEPVRDQSSVLRDVPVADIDPNPHQPRQHFDEETLVSLAGSVREVGVLQPVLVRPSAGGRFELIAGERRWRAAMRAGLDVIPAIVRETGDLQAVEQALVENLHRQDLGVLEEASGYQQLIEDFGLTHEDVATRVGKSRSAVTNTLRLLQLPPSIQQLVASGRLSAGHARALMGTPDRAFQEALAGRAVRDQLSVRDVEEAVRQRGDLVQSDSPPRVTKARLRPPGLLELEELLSSYLDTRVKVDMGAKRGKVLIEFATLEDLERIYRRVVERSPAPADHPEH
ncbi:MAG: ParB/RepB/Spo0J family partition protein [Acidimicrobiales bacterium]